MDWRRQVWKFAMSRHKSGAMHIRLGFGRVPRFLTILTINQRFSDVCCSLLPQSAGEFEYRHEVR